jgi:hypothetical protein
MFINYRKSIKKGRLAFLTLGLLFLILVLSSGSNFLHNHEPDFKIHHDCPGYQIFLLFNTIIIFTLIVIFIQSFFSKVILLNFEKPDLNSFKIYNSRSPPLQIS